MDFRLGYVIYGHSWISWSSKISVVEALSPFVKYCTIKYQESLQKLKIFLSGCPLVSCFQNILKLFLFLERVSRVQLNSYIWLLFKEFQIFVNHCRISQLFQLFLIQLFTRHSVHSGHFWIPTPSNIRNKDVGLVLNLAAP